MVEFDWNNTSYQHILTSIQDKVLTIMLNRPESRNAWTEVMRNEIIEAVDDCQRDPDVRVIVITGHPDGRAFCAGMDLSGMPGGGVMPGDSHPARVGHSAFARDGGGQASLAVARSLKPVICAINGAAVGIGATFPCACDLRIAAADAKYGFVFGQRGLTMEGCSSFFLPRLVGMTKANDFVLTARIFECASEADCGLFTEVVPSEEVMPRAMEIAKHMATNVAPMSMMLNKHMILRGFAEDMSPEQAHLVESKFMAGWRNPDNAEGVNSFLEKRPPEFTSDPWRDTPPSFPWWNERSVVPSQPRYDRSPQRPDLSKL